MNSRRTMLGAAALAGLLWAAPARAGTALGLGADYLLDPEVGAFQATLAVESPLARHLTIGGRFGAMLLTDPGRLGIPIDLRLRLRTGGVYLDGLIGPWIVLDDGDAVRFHAAAGFGVLGRSASFGLEVGVLNSTAMVGLRLAFPL
ncbi:hypothetical protein [Anaeromyxobacter oryzae]|uniref:Outer membrane protein beta-barrel domain-containing protein n=1 Tax=Anaeromyxobacter oryzae TaxID=2918170 RepID=A0ABM7WNQ6_9BACT|nr:hypothetical protein [Anaeromyxobacter oryzae]BDG01099.1 hypothetical protein AMOR_00950 [Anaeromyxobacter oryzae]